MIRFFTIRKGRGVRAALCVAACAVSVASRPVVGAGAGDGAASRGTEPTVTARESEVLRRALDVAATNAEAAVALLLPISGVSASAAVEFTIGNIRFQHGRLDEAVASYEAALAKLPSFHSARMNLGRVQLLRGHNDEAAAAFRRVLRDEGVPDPAALVLLGHTLYADGAAVAAEAAYRQALIYERDAKGAMEGVAKCLLSQARYREGAAMLGELLRTRPNEGVLWSLRAQAYVALEQPTLAIRVLETARRLECADASMLATLGDLYVNAGQPDDAVPCYDAAFRGPAPAISGMLRAADGLLACERPEAAADLIARLKARRESAPEAFDADATRALGRLGVAAARQRGDARAAIAASRAMLRDDPLDGRTLLDLGDLLRREGRLDEAEDTYARASRIAGCEFRALVCGAQVDVERERYGEAVRKLETALVFKDEPRVRHYLEQLRRLETLASSQ